MNFYTNVRVYGNKVLYRGIHDGKRVTKRFGYKPSLFVPAEEGEYLDISGKKYGEIEFEDINAAKRFRKQFQDVENARIMGNPRFEYPFIKQNFPQDMEWDFNQIRIARIDIEVASEDGFPDPVRADEELTAITLKIGNRYITFGFPDYKPAANVTYIQCKDEEDLCYKFMDFWSSDYPDIIAGWNIQNFDVPYLFNRFRNVMSEAFAKKLSPWGVVMPKIAKFAGKDVHTYDIWGVPILDSMDMYRKFSPDGFRADSYALDNIAFIELGERKLDYSEHGDLNKLYKNNPQKHLDYNIRDVYLDEAVMDKYGLMNLALTMAYMNRVNYDDIFTQVRMWTVIVDNFLKDKKIVLDHNVRNSKQEYSGGFVLDPIRGMHDYVMSIDATSLYPSMIMQYNISPDTFIHPREYNDNMKKIVAQKATVEKMLEGTIDTSLLKMEDISLTPNNQLFRRDKKGFLVEIIDHMFQERVKFKKLQIQAEKQAEAATGSEKLKWEDEASRYKSLQTAIKLCLNSCYGALGNEYFLLYEVRQAEAITTSGRLAIQWIGRDINEYLTKITGIKKEWVIAQDTDSCYITLDELVKKSMNDLKDTNKVIDFMDKVSKGPLNDLLKKSSDALMEYTNAFQQKLDMKREALADRGVWTNKKRYFLNVWDLEGVRYSKPHIKITGLEAIKSTTPAQVRVRIKELCEIILNEDEQAVWKFIADYRKEFWSLDLDTIAANIGVNGLTTYKDDIKIFGFKCPMHVRAALIHNHLINEMGLDKKYDLIKEGNKIKFVMLKTPNEFNTEVIAWESVRPAEFNLEKLADYEAQFERVFLKPVEAILTTIGWTSERTNKLSAYFG